MSWYVVGMVWYVLVCVGMYWYGFVFWGFGILCVVVVGRLGMVGMLLVCLVVLQRCSCMVCVLGIIVMLALFGYGWVLCL